MLTKVRNEMIEPAFRLLPERMASEEAAACLLAIGLQSSRFIYRRQLGGPGRGFWQMNSSQVKQVLKNKGTRDLTRAVCAACSVDWCPAAVYQAMEYNDVLAAAFARLLLWSDPHPLPSLTDADSAWSLYQRCWDPQRPVQESWLPLYSQACQLLICPDEPPVQGAHVICARMACNPDDRHCQAEGMKA